VREIACIHAGLGRVSGGCGAGFGTVPKSTIGAYGRFVNGFCRVSTGFLGVLGNLSLFRHVFEEKGGKSR
jgi:hypothetical protein